jgi:hypothetical protein
MIEGLKVYIAGPITGTDDYKERFEKAEKYLRGQGALPMHSAGLPQGFSHGEYLYICFAMIDVCEAVFFLDGYSESEGSLKEFNYAATKKKRLLYEDVDPDYIDPAWKLDNSVKW